MMRSIAHLRSATGFRCASESASFGPPGMTMAQSFRNTIDAIQPLISAMKAVASP